MINPSRILLTLFTLMAVSKLLSGTITLRWTFADALISAHVGIIVFSAIYHGGTNSGGETTLGFGKGLENACSMLIDMGMAYFVGRVAVRNLACYRYYVRIILIIAVISAIFGLIETFSGFSLVNTIYHTFFPNVIDYQLTAKRLGFYRATATFRANILFGLYCATVFAIAFFIKPHHLNMKSSVHKIFLVLCVLGVFSSLSSGPWLALCLCFILLIYGRMARNIRSKWKILLIACGAVVLVLSVVSNRGPLRLIISYLTLDPHTGYGRLVLWDCIWAMMRDYWPLGWGWSDNWPKVVDWYIWASIDTYYGVYLVRSGVFAVLSILGFLFYCWFKMGRLSGRGHPYAAEIKGWILGTVCLFVAAVTVDIFGSMIFATYFLLGAGQILLTAREPVLYYKKLPRRGISTEENRWVRNKTSFPD